MFESISIASVLALIVLAYVFRKPISQFNEEAPEVVSNVLSTAVKSSGQLDTIISTNCLENEVACMQRVKAAVSIIEAEDLPNVQDAYNKYVNKKSKV